jgi:hypothetical protein
MEVDCGPMIVSRSGIVVGERTALVVMMIDNTVGDWGLISISSS